MAEWLEKTDAFIEFNGFLPLEDRGRITRKEANRLAKERYERGVTHQSSIFTLPSCTP